jgi:hypothetical protein
MNTMPAPAEIVQPDNYGLTRFNALRHGVLSRYTVLPWEDEAEYQTLLGALAIEHAPIGPTEEHLVEELAGIIWRKRRLRMAEAAVYREKLRHDATAYSGPDQVAGAAPLPITGDANSKARIPQAIAASPAKTARELRDVKRDQAMTQRALNILQAGGAGTYERALTAMHDETRGAWEECLAEDPEDGLTYARTSEALQAWISHNWLHWYEHPIAELKHRGAIRDQALGVAYAADNLDVPARYETHLDRKLERTLAMLIRLRDLRRPSVPG